MRYTIGTTVAFKVLDQELVGEVIDFIPDPDPNEHPDGDGLYLIERLSQRFICSTDRLAPFPKA